MVDDLEEILSNYDPEKDRSFSRSRSVATAVALELCPQHVKEWLTDCTAGDDGLAYSSDEGEDEVEWFGVGHNSTHYFSFGVRSDGAFIKKTSGPEYDKDCRCWYDKTTVRIVTLDEIPKNYWGHL